MGEHAVLSPSSAHLWTRCAAAPKMRILHPEDEGSKYFAEQGTAAHLLASMVLELGVFEVPHAYLGEVIYLDFVADEEMVRHVNSYLATIEDYLGSGVLMIEARLDISGITGELDAKGTGDAIILRDGELQIHDLKYGMRLVEAKHNPQLLIYAMAAYEMLSEIFDIKSILVKIHQPRRESAPEHRYTLEEFAQATGQISFAAAQATECLTGDLIFQAGNHCTDYYCSARAHCPALAAWCTENPSVDDISITQLSDLALRVPTIREWCTAIEARVKSLVLIGETVPGFKLVKGRDGNRAWEDPLAVEQLLRGLKLAKGVIYTEALKSAPQIIKEKDAGRIGPRQWLKIEPMITRAEGQPAVVPESDKRPTIVVHSDFDVLLDR